MDANKGRLQQRERESMPVNVPEEEFAEVTPAHSLMWKSPRSGTWECGRYSLVAREG